jgi:2-phosphosulfolactate phosphatase
MNIKICREKASEETPSDINIIIDVVRAFTVAHLMFCRGVSKIFFFETIQDAFDFKKNNPDFILCGEMEGRAIANFDLDNSPVSIERANLVGKTIIQRTTNGTRVLKNNLSSNRILVAGLTCAENTANYVSQLAEIEQIRTVNIIASHPSDDDDTACAEYIKGIITGSMSPSREETTERIRGSDGARKFLDSNNADFREQDFQKCLEEVSSNFVMLVDKSDTPPSIKKEII